MGSRRVSDEMVKDSIHRFLKTRVKDIQLEDIDEILLSYVVGILHDLVSYSDNEEQDMFDVEGFSEMLAAFFPHAETIPSVEITEWMFGHVKAQRQMRNRDAGFNLDIRRVMEETTNKTAAYSTSSSCRSSKTNSESSDFPFEEKTFRLSESEDGQEIDEPLVGKLLEIFPYSCHVEVNHCLTMMGGDIERASQLIIYRHDNGQSLQATDRKPKIACRANAVEDKQLREKIVGKYGYVDQAEDSRYHRPILKKDNDKKMIRYRDGKIVSTKGERFTQVTKQESDEMKKSYVNMQTFIS